VAAVVLFNSPEFIFLFLPAAVFLHFTLARWSINAAIVGTATSSLFFFAWWNPPYILLPILSALSNFWLAIHMAQAGKVASRRLLVTGIVGNLAVLCYYKYADFLLSIVDGHKFTPPQVPLALSFTTFVQIGFLVYVHERRLKVDFNRYFLFLAFFPHLIAGPVVRWGSLGKQLADHERYRPNWNNIALGLTIFVFGLAKKLLIADELSPHVATVFDAASRGEPVTALAAWTGCVAFSTQIYFDFSGYSDMAVGLGLLFNLRLPINFAAPLRATNMFDLWRRWHITVCRLARDLIYVPISRANPSRIGRTLALVVTMMVLGIWHGAGWTFVAWGAYNVVLLLINQSWQTLRPHGTPGVIGNFLAWLLTFTAFSAGAVFFRAADIETSMHLIRAMIGFGEPVVAQHLTLDLDYRLISDGYVSEAFILQWFGTAWSIRATLWTAAALAVALFVPDTMEITGYREGDAQSNWRRPVGPFAWMPSARSLAIVVILVAITFGQLGRVSEFLYYQF